MDEISMQLPGEVRPPLPATAGQVACEDDAYVGGVVNLLLVCEPLHGWRQILVSDRRTRRGFAHGFKDLVDVQYPAAERIVLVLDNRTTRRHRPATLDEAFPPAAAKRLADKLEIHHAPKHGSWLNMAEIDLSVLMNQCLDRRIPRPRHAQSGGGWLGGSA